MAFVCLFDLEVFQFTFQLDHPQGSMLGPLLFILYINDIQNCSDIVSTLLLADDTSIFLNHSCLKTRIETLQKEINKLAEWLNINKLSINTSKQNISYSGLLTKNQNIG